MASHIWGLGRAWGLRAHGPPRSGIGRLRQGCGENGEWLLGNHGKYFKWQVAWYRMKMIFSTIVKEQSRTGWQLVHVSESWTLSLHWVCILINQHTLKSIIKSEMRGIPLPCTCYISMHVPCILPTPVMLLPSQTASQIPGTQHTAQDLF